MPLTIIVKDGKPRGITRTRTDERLRDAWGTSSFRSEEDADKCAYLERKLKKHFGADDSRITAAVINQVEKRKQKD